MEEYITKAQAKAAIKKRLGTMDLFASRFDADIDALPAANVAPVVHGRWIERFDGRYGQRRTYCSVCNKHSGIGGNKQEPPFCPHCGAHMKDGE